MDFYPPPPPPPDPLNSIQRIAPSYCSSCACCPNSFSADPVMAYNRPDDPLPSDPLTPTPTPDPLTPPPDPSYVKWHFTVSTVLFTVAAVLVLISMKTSTATLLFLIMRFFIRKQALYGRMGNGHSMEVEENGENGHSMDVLDLENGENGHSMEVEENGENGHSMDILDLEELNCLEDGRGICTYTKKELAKATGNFKTKVGQGVSGFVYRANLPGNRMGAVKKAHKNLDLIGQELFKQELSVLLRLPRHPHLVDLIGLCLQEGLPVPGTDSYPVKIPMKPLKDLCIMVRMRDSEIHTTDGVIAHRMIEGIMIKLSR